MENRAKTLLKSYFDEHSFVGADIESFNNFIDNTLNEIIKEEGDIEPTIIPPNVEEFKIRLDKIYIEKPEIVEADGSKRLLLPVEARLRKISYAAPIYIEVSAHVNGVQRESFVTQIGRMPVMVKSKYCHLCNLSRQELIERGEDPSDPGGYFIVNGTEKVIVTLEDLASNRLTVEQDSSSSNYIGKLFSEKGSYKIPHTFEKAKDGLFYASFTRVKKIPVILLIKALGMLKDEDIVREINLADHPEVMINLFEYVEVKDEEEALDQIAKKIGITQTREVRVERIREILNKYLLPHIGVTDSAKKLKAKNLCKIMYRYILVADKKLEEDDKDHYANKRLKLSGDLLADLFRVNLKVLIGDMLYNFQRIVKRGKFPSLKVIIRDKLLTQKLFSSLATGNWIGGRKGISQRMDRMNYLATLSNLQRVVSPLSASQENFEARSLHATQLGRLCPSETPEGTNIGLRKNLALLARVSLNVDENQLVNNLRRLGLELEE